MVDSATPEHPFGSEATELGLVGMWGSYDAKMLKDLIAETDIAADERNPKGLRVEKA